MELHGTNGMGFRFLLQQSKQVECLQHPRDEGVEVLLLPAAGPLPDLLTQPVIEL